MMVNTYKNILVWLLIFLLGSAVVVGGNKMPSELVSTYIGSIGLAVTAYLVVLVPIFNRISLEKVSAVGFFLAFVLFFIGMATMSSQITAYPNINNIVLLIGSFLVLLGFLTATIQGSYYLDRTTQ